MINPIIPKINEKIEPIAANKRAARPPKPIGGNKRSFNKESITTKNEIIIPKINKFRPYFFFFSNSLSLIKFIKKYKDKIKSGRGINFPSTSKISYI